MPKEEPIDKLSQTKMTRKLDQGEGGKEWKKVRQGGSKYPRVSEKVRLKLFS